MCWWFREKYLTTLTGKHKLTGMSQSQMVVLDQLTMARLGGRARAEKLTPKRRREIASLGGKARAKQIRRAKTKATSAP